MCEGAEAQQGCRWDVAATKVSGVLFYFISTLDEGTEAQKGCRRGQMGRGSGKSDWIESRFTYSHLTLKEAIYGRWFNKAATVT